jgi:serine/threonine protein kinase
MLGPGVLIDDRHEIERLLGRGEMAEVFRARNTATGQSVAIKVLRSVDPQSMARHRGEIEVLSRLHHPGVIGLLGHGDHDGVPYLVLELAEGPSLAEVIDIGPLGLDRSISIGRQLAAALAHAHALGVIHRDLKPANVLVGADPMGVRLADFGIARFADTSRITAAGLCMGTAAYLAPEQLKGQVGPAADIYALGLVVLECITGTRCYTGTVAETVAARLHRSPVIPLDLPVWLRHTLRAMTAREPSARPAAGSTSDAFRCLSVGPVLEPTVELGSAGRASRAPSGAATRDRATDRVWDARTGRRLLIAFGGGALTSAAALAVSLKVGRRPRGAG